MREDLDKRLCAEFPLLYRDRHGDKTETCMCWGFPGDGWFHVIYRLSAALEPLIAAQPDDEKRAVAAQVKEKFGNLCFYMDYPTGEMRALVRKAQNEAATICEMCGVPGRKRPGGWIKTLCDWCDADRQRRREEETKEYIERLRRRKEEKAAITKNDGDS